MQIERSFVTLEEGQLHLRRLHAARAPQSCPLLLLHASPSSSWFMQGLMKAIAERGASRHLIAPDTLGNGDSAPPRGERPDIAYFADSLRRMLDELAVPQVDVYGSHTGARIACELAAAFPQRVRRVIFDGIIEYDDATRQLIVDHYAPQVAPDHYGRHLLWAFNFVRDQALYFPYFQRDPAHRLAGAMPDAATLHRATLDVLKALDSYSKPYLAAFEYRAYSRMPRVRAPVLLLRPDAELPVLNEAIAQAIAHLPDARVARVGAGDAAKAAAITGFLDSERP